MELGIGSPVELELAYFDPDAGEPIELTAQALLKSRGLHSHGEWFNVDAKEAILVLEEAKKLRIHLFGEKKYAGRRIQRAYASRSGKRSRGRPPKPLEELLRAGSLRMDRHAGRILAEAPDEGPWIELKQAAQVYIEGGR